MKNKKIYIIGACLFVLFVVLAILGYVIKNKGVNPNNPKDPEPEMIITDNSRIYKNFVFEVANNYSYSEIDEYIIKIGSDNWTATLEPLIDEYGHIISYAKCTQLIYDISNVKLIDNYKAVNNSEDNYITFKFTYTIDETEENDVMMYYDLGNHYVMKVELINNDNSFNEEGLKEIISILKTRQYNPKKEYNYHYYPADYYHQCHDIDQKDAEDMKRIDDEIQKRIQEETKTENKTNE